jgi:cyclophilin family peptidyl-prolyl cis-trans isomerase
MVSLWAATLCCLFAIVLEASGLTLKTRAEGGDDGADDDDDGVSIATQRKTRKKGGFDVGGHGKGLKKLSSDGVIDMLKAMDPSLGSMDDAPADAHVVGSGDSQEIGDIGDPEDVKAKPAHDTKPGELDQPLDSLVASPPAPTAALPTASLLQDARPTPLPVSGPPATTAPLPRASLLQDTQPAPVPVVLPAVPTLQLAPVASNSGLSQSLAVMRHNMDMLMGQVATVGAPPPIAVPVSGAPSPVVDANAGAFEARLEQVQQSFAAEEQKLEGKVEELRNENHEMRRELQGQSQEIQNLEHSQGVLGTVRKSMAAQKSNTSAYAAKPWDVTFIVHLDGKAGGKQDSFTVRVHPEWAPEGAKRFQDIVQKRLLQDARFFRVLPGFMVQFGIPGLPEVAAHWRTKGIPDDPVKKSNTRGMMSFAMSGKNTRTTQVFINYANNAFLDEKGFSPFAEVLADGMDVVDKIQRRYRERPDQGKIQKEGNAYLAQYFPQLSFIGHVDSTLSQSMNAAGFIQKSSAAVDAHDDSDQHHQAFRFGGIATFFHHKVARGE